MSQNVLMSKKQKKVCTVFESSWTLTSFSFCSYWIRFKSAMASLGGISIKIMSSKAGIKICSIYAGIKK